MVALTDAFGVYVHVPYCRRICPYCDFNVAVAGRADWPGLARGLEAELASRAAAFAGAGAGPAPDALFTAAPPPASSLYFGGGTPSLAPAELLAQVRRRVETLFGLVAGAEVTIEIDPKTLDAAGFAALRRLGVTRVSLGWQSTHDPLLRLLGRGHTAADSEEAFRLARAAGFLNVSVDLIFAVPGETPALLERDLDAVERLGADHVSLYALTYHEGTELHRRRERGRIAPVGEDLEAEMMARIEERLTRAGYEHYEVSNYARPDKRSRHNQLYWHGGRYLGAGPGAHSFARAGWERGWRWESIRAPARYIEAWAAPRAAGLPVPGDPTVTFVETLTPRQLLDERFLVGLRLRDGVDVGELPLAAGDAARLERAAAAARARGWIEHAGGRLLPTPAGLMHADALAELFF